MEVRRAGPVLDDRWIRDGLVKRMSNYSPVICYETADPRRLYQLKELVLEGTEGFPPFDKVLVYDRWEGLGFLRRTPSGPAFEPYRRPPSAPVARYALGDPGGELLQFKSALREADRFLKRERTLFLLQNLAENREWESGLQSALRSWAIDSSVISSGSTVFLVTADVSQVLDEYTAQLVVVVTVDPSSREERGSIVTTTARELGVELPGERAAELVMATAGLNLHQVESILLEAYHRERRFDPALVRDLKSTLVKRSGVLEVREPEFGFGDIGGYEAVKDFVRQYIINVLKNPERARRFALPLPRGILFFGPPGTGKSLFANALAAEIQLPFIHLVTENIYSRWLGESGQRMRNAITLAEKMSPAVVFVDEIDRFGRRHGGFGDSAGEETRRVFSQFLEWLGRPDREAIIVGTTNVPEHLDEAFTRTGRFDYKIPFLYPGDEARLDILLVHLGLKPQSRRPRPPLAVGQAELEDFLAREIVPRTANFSGAELEELVTRAKRTAFDRGAEGLEPRDLAESASSFRVEEARRRRVVENCLEQARRFTDDRRFLEGLREEMGAEL